MFTPSDQVPFSLMSWIIFAIVHGFLTRSMTVNGIGPFIDQANTAYVQMPHAVYQHKDRANTKMAIEMMW